MNYMKFGIWICYICKKIWRYRYCESYRTLLCRFEKLAMLFFILKTYFIVHFVQKPASSNALLKELRLGLHGFHDPFLTILIQRYRHAPGTHFRAFKLNRGLSDVSVLKHWGKEKAKTFRLIKSKVTGKPFAVFLLSGSICKWYSYSPSLLDVSKEMSIFPNEFETSERPIVTRTYPS